MQIHQQNASAAQVLRTAQVIVPALAGGVLGFGIIALILGPGLQPLDPGAVVSLTMAAFGVVTIVARLVVPPLIARSELQRVAAQLEPSDVAAQDEAGPAVLDDNKLAPLFLTQVIIANALLEGGALGNLVAFLIEGQPHSLALAALLLLGILAGFPTRSRLDDWLARQRRTIDELQATRGMK